MSTQQDTCVLDHLDVLLSVHLLPELAANMVHYITGPLFNHFYDGILVKQLHSILLPSHSSCVRKRVGNKLTLDHMDNLASFLQGGDVCMEVWPTADQGSLLLVFLLDLVAVRSNIPVGGTGAESDVYVVSLLLVVSQQLCELVISDMGKS